MSFFIRVPLLRICRPYSQAASGIFCSANPTTRADVRAQLLASVKHAMKNKDTLRSTTLRAVLAEVYSADKTANNQINSSAILAILRKAATRRRDAAVQYTAAQRSDLADKELSEAHVLSQFLPSLLTEEQVDNHLREVLNQLPKDASMSAPKPGSVFKLFYNVVDKSTVDPDMVKRRLEVLLQERS